MTIRITIRNFRIAGTFRLCKLFIIAVILVIVLDSCGIFIYLRAKNYDTDFAYPHHGDISKYILQLRNKETPDMPAVNTYNATFAKPCADKCRDSFGQFVKPRLVYVVKSAPENFKNRLAIRNTWGYEKRFSDVIVRTVFVLGQRPTHLELQNQIDSESDTFHDIVQAKFYDSYFNNTLKTLTGLQWAVKYCPESQFYAFIDDDYYVSTKNVLRFIRNPVNYPQYLIDTVPPKQLRNKREVKRIGIKFDGFKNNLNWPIQSNKTVESNEYQTNQNKNKSSLILLSNSKMLHTFQKADWDLPNNKSIPKNNDFVTKNEVIPDHKKVFIKNKDLDFKNQSNTTLISEHSNKILSYKSETNSRIKRQNMDYDMPSDVRLFAGKVMQTSPLRQRFSKWFIDLNEYPYNKWPPYITAGAYILSKEALLDMFYATFYTKLFRFDDIYLALAAIKANIDLFNCDEFYLYKKPYDQFTTYKYVVATHGYANSEELLRIWNEQRSLNNA